MALPPLGLQVNGGGGLQTDGEAEALGPAGVGHAPLSCGLPGGVVLGLLQAELVFLGAFPACPFQP